MDPTRVKSPWGTVGTLWKLLVQVPRQISLYWNPVTRRESPLIPLIQVRLQATYMYMPGIYCRPAAPCQKNGFGSLLSILRSCFSFLPITNIFSSIFFFFFFPTAIPPCPVEASAWGHGKGEPTQRKRHYKNTPPLLPSHYLFLLFLLLYHVKHIAQFHGYLD